MATSPTATISTVPNAGIVTAGPITAGPTTAEVIDHGGGGRDAEYAISTRGLTKRYGSQVAVDAVDLAVPRGAVYGFLGPNGSGKTTTIRVLLGLAGATSGEADVLGESMPRHARSVLPRVGALVEGPAFYPFLSGPANLARLDAADRDAPARTRRRRIGEAIERVGLTNAAGKRVRAYSLGMKQRLGIAAALLTPRELMVLDEPTNGLDPQGTREVRSLVRSIAADGATVFVSSHLLTEIEQVCTHIGVMSAGRLVAQGTIESFAAGDARVRVDTPDASAAAGVLVGLGLGDARAEADVVQARIDAARSPAVEDVVAALVGAGVRVRGVAVERASLEDRFVQLTGEGFEVVR